MDSGDEDELTLGERDYQKVDRNLHKSGIRDGASKVTEEALQSSFDTAYEFGYRHSLKFGQLQGLIEATITFNPSTKEVLQPLLTKVTESHSHFMKINLPEDAVKMEEEEKNWSQKLLKLVEQFKELQPPMVSKIETVFK